MGSLNITYINNDSQSGQWIRGKGSKTGFLNREHTDCFGSQGEQGLLEELQYN